MRVRGLRRLGPKLFISYVLIVVVGSLVLWTTAEAVAPTAFSRHLRAMVGAMGQPHMMADLFAAFLRAMNTALAVAATAAFLSAVAVSIFVTRRIVAPVRAMMTASARIADGRYGERVPVTSDDELGELAGQFNRMATALEQVERMRRDLIADVAHELRTPLASIAGYMEALIDGVLPAEPETFHRIRREASRLQRLVSDLQELSRVEAGQIPILPQPVEVRELADAAAARMRPQFEDKGVVLAVDIPRNLPRVLADPDRIGQVLTNLLGNALQHTPEGGRVTIQARREQGMVAIAVADTGAGIAPEHLPHLFDRFYRVDPSRARRSGGSGIGLTIARHLVERHGGSIRAESEGPGHGATFTFTIPAAG
ncbi:MAG: ATP-binding protein [Armatimonadota bacterium]|nr:ATP-binding protein [Armatimonadota bacterium]MDR7451309.1 ATP-binding protein [Armatimonadota bacterium]MDR7466788.1 ATP-binding protein [Armatimonadota bacterium]MDR7492739.1 ATP-binding protein [Armatimonadota bacterium]MDR7498515.1 ATP-binding protein [Armatimonadota bacterium]